MFQSGAHGGQGECVAGERAADAADVHVFEMEARGNALGDFFGDAVGRAGNAAADGLAENEDVWLQIPFARASAGAGADGVRFVGDEERSVTASEFAGNGPIAVVG